MRCDVEENNEENRRNKGKDKEEDNVSNRRYENISESINDRRGICIYCVY